MSGSLKDQLIALGLAGNKPGTNARKKQAQGKPRCKPEPKSGDGISLDAAWKARQREEQQASEQKAAAKRAEDLRRRQVNAEVEALVAGHALNDPEADLKRNFLYKGRIRSVPVTAAQLRALNKGELALVFLRGRYLILAPDLVAQVRALSAEHVPDLGGADTGEADEEFPVPDDLVW